MIKFYIDPGHGGDSIGASYRGRLEQDDTLRLSKAVRERLKNVAGVEVRLSREGNTNPLISERCAEANAWGADYFISIHRNAFSPEKARGAEAWIISSAKTGGNTWSYARKIVDGLVKAGFNDRGVHKGAPSYADFGVNRLTKMHSCLLEAGFIDSTADNKIFDEHFGEIAEAIARALCEIAEIPYKTAEIAGASAKAEENSGASAKTEENSGASAKTEEIAGASAKTEENSGASAKTEEKRGSSGKMRENGEKVTVEDARTLLRMATGLDETTAEALLYSDTDADGKITVEDARAALRKAIGLE